MNLTNIEDKGTYRMFYKVYKAMKEQVSNYKLVYVGTAKWTNACTNQEEHINGLYILGKEASVRPIIITRIKIKTNSDLNEYIMHETLTHCNISEEDISHRILLQLDGIATEVELIGYSFCNPLTAEHVFSGNEKDIKNLVKANLLSQNFDDVFSLIKKAGIDENDYLIGLHDNITRTSSPIELLLSKHAMYINIEDEYVIDRIKKIKSIKEDEILAKHKSLQEYGIVKKSKYRKDRDRYSNYYPTFDYEYIKEMDIETPVVTYDIGVYGLGSAGTAILDQLGRSKWIEKILLCDFDEVESKNINNQWYTKNDLGINKTTASYNKLKEFERNMGDFNIKFDIKTENVEFENTYYEDKKFKYLISGFDSIKTRQNFFKEIQEGRLKTEYLIDCRYLDLAGSVYIIDTSNEEQMKFYKANLDADGELLEEQKHKLTREEFEEWILNHGDKPLKHECGTFQRNKLHIVNPTCKGGTCGGTSCIDGIYEKYLENWEKVNTTENTCIKFNYIDIYKYIGAIVFGAIRNIENGLKKPFTLLEAETDVNGLPNYMIVKE